MSTVAAMAMMAALLNAHVCVQRTMPVEGFGRKVLICRPEGSMGWISPYRGPIATPGAGVVPSHPKNRT